MEEDGHKSGLYRWQRQTKPRVQSRSHRVKHTDDIQDWIKKVEEASNKAADVAFGLVPSGKERGKAIAQHRAGQVRDSETAHTEAQELLTQWVNENIRFDEDDGYDDLEAWRRARQNKLTRQNDTVRKENNNNNKDSEDFSLDRLTKLALEDDFDVDEAAIYERVKRSAVGDGDPYASLYDMEESDAVDSVLQNMLSKEVVKETFKKDLGFNDDKKPDPRVKMNLRHKMVKENREKRQKEEGRKKMEAQMKKEARLKAQQLILKEQKDRELRSRKEDMELKKEMAKIRKDMHEERRRKEEEMRSEREEKEVMDRLAREELERQRAMEEKELIASHRQENDRRKRQLIKVEMIKTRIASKNLQCLHRHFTAWYDVVLSKRLLLGKVKAMSDWKLMLKIWGAWRSHVKGRRLEAETEIHERNIIDSQRKTLAAERHFSLTTLQRCFTAWQVFTHESVEKKEMEKDQERTKSKMLSLLHAVAEGKLGKEEGEEKKGGKTKRNKDNGPVDSSRLEQQHSGRTDRDNQPHVRKQAWVDDEDVQSSRSDTSVNQTSRTNTSRATTSAGSKGRSLPSQPWQVTRQHLKLSKQAMSNLGQDGEGNQPQEEPTDAEVRRRFGTQPWMNRHYVVNNFEHRYTAQQQALRDQQNQIKEQRQLIEELQYEQRQQALKHRLVQGTNAPPLPPTVEVEVPPKGKQIPRGDEEETGGIASSNSTSCKNNAKHSELKDKKIPLNHGAKRLGQNGSDGADTDRSSLTTSRSTISSATNVTNMTTSTAKTHNTKYLQVLKNMEDRAAQRAKLKAERDEKRRIQEEEKLALLQQQEEEKLKEIEAEKKAKAEAYRQKKRLEKQKEEEKQRQLAHLEEMTKKAEEHYTRSILKYRGLLPFKKIISLSKRNWAKAVKHRDREVMRQCLRGWKTFAEEEANQKKSMADQMHQFLVIKHSFQNWRNYKYHAQFLERRAERHYLDNLKSKVFQAWTEWVVVEREESLNKMEMAREHFLRYLVQKSFLAWRHLPEQLKRQEERQKRKLELRKRVAELVPDFEPTTSVKVENSEDLG